MPRDEVDTILREEGLIEALCHSCGTIHMGGKALKKFLARKETVKI